MQPFFIFKNVDSRDMGVLVNKLPPINKPEKNIERIEVVGRNGFLTQDYGTYKSNIKPVECTLLDKNRLDEVCSWLDGTGNIVFSNEDNKAYTGTIINQIPFTQSLTLVRYRFIINFEVQPFKYDRYNTEIIKIIENNVIRNSKVIHPLAALNYTGGNLVEVNKMATINESNSMEINNPGTKESDPVITIYGYGNIDLNINDNIINLTNVSSSITIDSEIMDCYRDGQLFNNYMKGEFPIFKTGVNKISWMGNVQRIEIKPNWRWL
ncbi:TPA: phage tail protein [Clostridium botulinum]|nr:phage tail protein [Clostridium botulinum]